MAQKSAFSMNRKSKNFPDNDEGGHNKLETESSKTDIHPESLDKIAAVEIVSMHTRNLTPSNADGRSARIFNRI
jgi:hypothetical protein